MLNVGLLPDEASDVLKQRYQSLLKHLAESIGVDLHLVIHDDYDHLNRLFDNVDSNLAFFTAGLPYCVPNRPNLWSCVTLSSPVRRP